MENVALEILKYNATLPNNEAVLWPCFVGTTGTGKTARSSALATNLQRTLHTLLLGTMMPEDISGLPRIMGKTAEWILPTWAMEEGKKLIFLDEIDKAKPDHWATILTLLTSRRLRDREVDACFLAACQPVDRGVWLCDETGKALSARLVFLPVYPDVQWIAKKHSITAPTFLSGRKDLDMPVLDEPSPRQLDWLVGFARSGVSPEVLACTVQGIITPPLVPEVMDWLRESCVATTAKSLIDVLAENPERIESLSGQQLAHIYPELWIRRNLPLEVPERVLARLLEVVSPDELVTLQKALIENVISQPVDAKGQYDFLEPHSMEDVSNMLVRAITRGKKLRDAREAAK